MQIILPYLTIFYIPYANLGCFPIAEQNLKKTRSLKDQEKASMIPKKCYNTSIARRQKEVVMGFK